MKPIKVLLVDDHAIVRMGLASLLRTAPEIEVVGAAADGAAALRETARTNPDVILMDLQMPKMDGAETTAALLKENPDRKVLILTTFGTADGISHALASGAKGAVLKSIPFESLVKALCTVAGGGTYIDAELQQILGETKPIPALSPRQTEILKSVSHGMTNEAIAEQLGISVPMVRQHLNALFVKIGAQNRAEAVAIAMRKMLLKI